MNNMFVDVCLDGQEESGIHSWDVCMLLAQPKKKGMFSWAKVRIIYSAVQVQICYYPLKPRNDSNLPWSSCQISNMDIHTTCTIPGSRKPPSGLMFFYHQIVCEEKYSAGIWTRVNYILVSPPTHAEIAGLTLTWPLNLACFYTIYSNSS